MGRMIMIILDMMLRIIYTIIKKEQSEEWGRVHKTYFFYKSSAKNSSQYLCADLCLDIARSLLTQPKLLIADKITSMLDTSTSANIIRVLRTIQNQSGFAMLYITSNCHRRDPERRKSNRK